MPNTIEQGARPTSGPRWRRALGLARSLTTPLRPDDYLALLDARWSDRELVGTVSRVIDETPSARTIVVEPSAPWPGHRPGQYLRLGVELNGVRHWRAYSITSDPGHPAGQVSITVQRVEGGLVSPYLTEQCQPGDRLFLGDVDGNFCLPDGPAPGSMLMITAGCGITPVMSMLRELERRDALLDIVHVHVSQKASGFIFAGMLRALSDADNGYHLIERHSAEQGRLHHGELDTLVPDWRTRTTYLSGPSLMMAEFEQYWADQGDSALLNTEQFQPYIGLGHDGGSEGGHIGFRVSGLEAEAESGVSILVAGERVGAQLPHGCRMGICHSCIGRLQSGQVRDLRTGEVHGEAGQAVRTCVNAPVGNIEIEL